MESPSLILVSYQDALGRAMDVVANNVANVNTTGFKREDVLFETLLSQPTTKDKYEFAIDRATYRDTSAGPLVSTGNPLDIALEGNGYLSVQTTSGIRYMRAGSFQMNSDGEVITGLGDKLLGESDQPITIPSDIESINISSDGIVTGKSATNTAVTQLGKIKIVKFEREQNLQGVGGGRYYTSEAPQTETGCRIVQGMIERSNVEPVTEMTKMISVLRAYQQTTRMAEVEAERMKDAITKLSRATA